MYHELRTTRLALALVLLGVGVAITLFCSYTQKQAEAMQELVKGYEVCMNAESRVSDCALEHDGENNTPADYGWYWK